MPRRKKIEEGKVRIRKKVQVKVKNRSKAKPAATAAPKENFLDPAFQEEVAKRIEETEKNKRLVMWSGVTFFMLAIVVIWFLNIRSVFEAAPADTAQSDFDWSKISEEFSQTIEEAKENFNEIKSQMASTTPEESSAENNENASTSESDQEDLTATSSEELAPQEDFEELKKRIEELEKKFEN